MTKRKILATLFLIALLSQCNDTQAQRHHRRGGQVFRAYPVAGFTASQIRGDELRGFKKWGMTAGVGAMLAVFDNSLWNLSVEADFSQRGAYNGTGDPYNFKEFTLNYVDIPLSVHFTDPYGGITFGAGLSYSRLVSQPHGKIFYNPKGLIPDTTDMSFLKNDIAAVLDFRLPIWRGLTVNVRYQHSILPIKKQWQFSEPRSANDDDMSTWANDCYNSSLSVRIMYVFGDDNHKKYASKKSSHKKRR